MAERPPKCRPEENACTISELHALEPKLAQKRRRPTVLKFRVCLAAELSCLPHKTWVGCRVHLHVRAYAPLFRVSGTTERIVLEFCARQGIH